MHQTAMSFDFSRAGDESALKQMRSDFLSERLLAYRFSLINLFIFVSVYVYPSLDPAH